MKTLREKIHVNESTYQNAQPRDKSLINILALFTPISAGMVGFAVFYCIYFLISYWLIAVTLGVCATTAFYYHDTTLLGTFKKSTIYARLIFSFMLIIIVAIPLKMNMVGIDNIEKKMKNNVFAEIERVAALEIEKIEDEQRVREEAILDAAEVYDRTKGGKQKLIDARRLKKEFLETKDKRLQDIRDRIEKKKNETEISRTELTGYYATNMFSSNSPAEMIINMIVLILALLFETLPVFVRIAIEDGHFMRDKEHIERYSIKADSMLWSVDEEIFAQDGIENFAELILKRSVYGELKNQIKNGYGSPETLIKLAKEANMMKDKPQQEPVDDEPKHQQDEDEIPEYEY